MYKFITHTGERNLRKFLTANVVNFQAHNFNDWISHAESVAMSAEPKEDLIIEVSMIESISGRPETLKMSKSWFTSRGI